MGFSFPIVNETLKKLQNDARKRTEAQRDQAAIEPGLFEQSGRGGTEADRRAATFTEVEQLLRWRDPVSQSVGAFFESRKGPVVSVPTPQPQPIPKSETRFLSDDPAIRLAQEPAFIKSRERAAKAEIRADRVTGFETFTETVDAASAALGGSLIDVFNQVKAGDFPLTFENFTKRDLGLKGTIERQQARGIVPRLLSESLTPFEAAALLGISIRASRVVIAVAVRAELSKTLTGVSKRAFDATVDVVTERLSVALRNEEGGLLFGRRDFPTPPSGPRAIPTRSVIGKALDDEAERLGRPLTNQEHREVVQNATVFTGEPIFTLSVPIEAAPPPPSGPAGLPPVRQAERFKQLEELGWVVDSSVNEFAAPLRPIEDVISEVVTHEGPAGRALGIAVGPSVSRTSDVGKIATAAQRQKISVDELVSIAMAASFDSHLSQFRRVLPINPRTGTWEGANVPWQRVFEAPDKFAKHITPEARRLIDDVNQMTNQEANRLLEDAGIGRKVRDRPADEYYVPRNVEEIRGIETRRGSDPGLSLHYDDITEGLRAGVVYGKDPRQDIELYMRWVYRQVAKKQLDDALLDSSLSRSQLIPENIQTRFDAAQNTRTALKLQRNRLSRSIRTSEAQGRVAAGRGLERTQQLERLNTELDRLDSVIGDLPTLGPIGEEATRLELQNARREIRAADSIVRRVNRELATAEQQLARTIGRGAASNAELTRLEAQFDRLAELRDEIVQSSAAFRGEKATLASDIRRQELTQPRFRTLGTEETRARRGAESAAERVERIQNTRVRLSELVSDLKDDLVVSRGLTKEANTRLTEASKAAARREGKRGVTRGKGVQAEQQRRRFQAQAASQGRRVATVEGLQAQIKMRVEFVKAQVNNLDEQIVAANTEFRLAKTDRSRIMEELKKAGSSPGALWGPNQPLEIAIKDWHSRFFVLEDAELLETALGKAAEAGLPTRVIQSLVNVKRTLAAGLDWALPMIQGQPVFAANPAAWGRSTVRHYQATFDPGVQSRLMRDNISDYQWLAQHGVPIGDPEFFAALQPGQGVSFNALFKILPGGAEAQRLLRFGGKQTFGRMQASYNTGLGWARVQLLKGARESWTGTDAELAQFLRNLTGGLDSRALGVGPARRAAEGMWIAFSPRLLRSTMALFKDALTPSLGQVNNRSRRALGVWMSGVASTYIMTGLALGKDWDDIQTGLNPLNGKRFLSHQINGDWIGVGGQVRAGMQLLYALSVDPSSILNTSRNDNPLLAFISGRGGIGLQAALQAGEAGVAMAGGEVDLDPFEKVDGPIDFFKLQGQGSLPFTLQGVMEGEQAITSLFAGQGFRTSEETPFDRLNEARGEAEKQLEIVRVDGKLDGDQKRDIDELVPQDIKDEASKARLDFGSKTEVLKLARKAVDDRIDEQITVAADSLGPSEAFRKRLTALNTERAIAKEQETQGDQHAEARQFFEELEPSEAVFDRAVDAYFAATTDERLEDELGNFNFSLREELLAGVKEEFGEELFNRVETFVHEREHPLATELREDRKTLEPYWEITEKFVLPTLNARERGVYQIWLNADRTDKSVMRENEAWNDIINSANNRKADLQSLMRENRPEIAKALAKWEYSTSRAVRNINRRNAFDARRRELQGATP